jgi:hypothetical protein
MSTRREEYDAVPEVEGTVVFEQGWYLLVIPSEVQAALLRKLEDTGEALKPSARPHISVMKDEAPCRNQADWGTAFVGERVKVKCHHAVRGENGLHFWVDCYSPRLCQMREHFGLPTLKRPDGTYLVNFHLTVARRKQAVEPQPRPQYRLTPQSHIDPETGMQHL